MGIRSPRRGHRGRSLRAVARWLAVAAVAALVVGTGVVVVASRGDGVVPVYAAPSLMPDNGYSSLLTNADGHLEAFVTAQNGVIYHTWEGVLGTWFGLAGPTLMQGSPVAGLNADGRGEAFAIGANGVLMHTWQPSWPAWNAVHAQPGLAFVGQPALSLNDDGRLEVFAMSSSGLYWHSWQLTPNGSWSDWYVMGAGVFSSDPVVMKNADGREEIFGVAAASPVWGALLPAPVLTGTVVHQWQSSPNEGWSPYDALGGQVQGKVSVVRGPDGRLELFALDVFGSMGHIWQQTAGGGWSSVWGDLGAYFWTGSPAAMANPDGRLEVFARSRGGQTWNWWQSPIPTWSGPGSLGGFTTGDPVVRVEPSQVVSLWVAQGTHWFENDRIGVAGWSGWLDRGSPPAA